MELKREKQRILNSCNYEPNSELKKALAKIDEQIKERAISDFCLQNKDYVYDLVIFRKAKPLLHELIHSISRVEEHIKYNKIGKKSKSISDTIDLSKKIKQLID